MAIKDIGEKAISLPFTIDGYGGIAATTSQEKIWADRVRVAINTGVTERVNNLRFGTNLSREVFNETSVVENALRAEIQTAFSVYLKLLTLNSVDITFNEIDNQVIAEVSYSIPDGRDNTLVVGTAVIFDGNLENEERP